MAQPHPMLEHGALHAHPMVTELLATLHEIEEKVRMELRFYEILTCASQSES